MILIVVVPRAVCLQPTESGNSEAACAVVAVSPIVNVFSSALFVIAPSVVVPTAVAVVKYPDPEAEKITYSVVVKSSAAAPAKSVIAEPVADEGWVTTKMSSSLF